MSRVAILISGGGSNMLRLVQDMRQGGYATPVLVASNDPAAAGLARAAALGIEAAALDHRTYSGRTAFEAALAQMLHAARPDVIALAGFMRILSPAFVAQFEGRMLNIHPSLLPKYPGLHTHARALAAGDVVAGCTVHHVTADLDAGPILGQAQVPILLGDTEDSLAARVLLAEHRLYPACLRAHIAGQSAPIVLTE